VAGEYDTEDATADAARDEPGFVEDRFCEAFRAGYAAGRSTGYEEGWAAGMDAALEDINKERS
jgi:hypothetical protein